MRRPVGVKWILLFFRWTRFFSCRVATTVAILPSALFVSAKRSVQVGRSRFSRCCHLIVDLPSHLKNESWARPLTQSPELGMLGFVFFLSRNVLCCCQECHSIAVPQRFVHFSADPQVVQQ